MDLPCVQDVENLRLTRDGFSVRRGSWSSLPLTDSELRVNSQTRSD